MLDDGMDVDLFGSSPVVDVDNQTKEGEPAAKRRRDTPSEAAPKSASTKTERALGVKKATRKQTRQCRGCSLWFAPENMASGSNFDVTCKYRVDGVYKIAKSQKRLEWYKEVMANDVSLQMVLAEYAARTTPDSSGRKNQTRRSSTFTVLESVAAKSAVVYENLGKMMYERQYLAFADTFDGGKLTEVQAKQQWLTWKEQAHEPNSTWPAKDNKGPNGELRLWVPTEDIIKFANSIEREKALTTKGKDVKNPTEEEVGKLQKSILMGHDQLSTGFEEHAGQMAQFSRGDAFQANNYDVGDVTHLLVPEKESQAEGSEPADECKEEMEDTGEQDEGKKSKAKWFDYDRKVSKAQSKFKSQQLRFRQDLEWHEQQAKDVVAQVNCMDPEKKETLLNALAICENRLEALSVVLGNDAEQLKQYIAKVKAGSAPGSSLAKVPNASSVAGRQVLGHAPPSASFCDLVIVNEVDIIAQEFTEAESDGCIKATFDKITAARAPIKELASSVHSQVKELTKLKDAAEKPAEQKGKGKKGGGKAAGKGKAGKGKDKGIAGASIAKPNFDLMTVFGPEIARELPWTASGAAPADQKDLDMSRPVILRLPELAKLQEQEPKSMIQNFLADFNKSEMKTKKGRGSQKCPSANPATQSIFDALEASMASFQAVFQDEDLDGTNPLMTFTSEPNQMQPVVELNYMASIRYQAVGAKFVLMASFVNLAEYMSATANVTTSPLTPVRAACLLRDMDRESLKACASKCEVFFGQIREGEALYTPFGFCTVEFSTVGSTGFSIRGVSLQDGNLGDFVATFLKPSLSDPAAKPSKALTALLCFLEKHLGAGMQEALQNGGAAAAALAEAKAAAEAQEAEPGAVEKRQSDTGAPAEPQQQSSQPTANASLH